VDFRLGFERRPEAAPQRLRPRRDGRVVDRVVAGFGRRLGRRYEFLDVLGAGLQKLGVGVLAGLHQPGRVFF